jgi:hypothetical protein
MERISDSESGVRFKEMPTKLLAREGGAGGALQLDAVP